MTELRERSDSNNNLSIFEAHTDLPPPSKDHRVQQVTTTAPSTDAKTAEEFIQSMLPPTQKVMQVTQKIGSCVRRALKAVKKGGVIRNVQLTLLYNEMSVIRATPSAPAGITVAGIRIEVENPKQHAIA